MSLSDEEELYRCEFPSMSPLFSITDGPSTSCNISRSLSGNTTELKVREITFSQTAVKRFASCGDSPRCSASDDTRPPSYGSSFSQTEVKKKLSATLSETVVKVDASTDTKDIPNITDRTSIQDAIEILKHQQDEIKRLQSIHEQHLKLLLASQPSLKQHMELKQKKDVFEQPKLIPPHLVLKETSPVDLFGGLLEEKIYVQLEQLYVNAKIFKTTPIGSSNGFYDDALRSEVCSLKEANRKLKEKVMELEKKLQTQEARGRFGFGLQVPDTPWSVSTGMKASKSLTQLDGCNINTNAIAGRPTSPVPPPLLIQDVRPIEMTFKWTIKDYTHKLREERKNGSKESSCPFYLSHCGYKAQLETYLNGNGSAKNRCISVFLRIIKGEYDRHLKWPVNLHVVVILVNQTENRADSLKAGGNLFQYTQPHGTSEAESDSWGLVEFVRHDVIKTRQYIRDDKIVLKCRVTILA